MTVAPPSKAELPRSRTRQRRGEDEGKDEGEDESEDEDKGETKARRNPKIFWRRDVYLLDRCALLGRRHSLLPRDIPFSAPIVDALCNGVQVYVT